MVAGALDTILIPSLRLEEILSDGSTLSNPAADSRRLFLGEDGLLHLKDSAGAVTDIAASGNVATDAIWDAAGDLVQGTGANTAAKLTIGANATFLTSNGTTAAWSARFAGARIQSSGDTTCTTNVWTKVLMATESYDTGTFTATSTATAHATGYFRVLAAFSWRNSTNAGVRYGDIYKNGASFTGAVGAGAGLASDGVPSHVLVDVIPVVNNDTVELYAYQNIGGNLNCFNAHMAVEFIPA